MLKKQNTIFPKDFFSMNVNSELIGITLLQILF